MENELSSAERQFWRDEAARNEIRREDHQRYADEYAENRNRALQKLGMIVLNNDNEELNHE